MSSPSYLLYDPSIGKQKPESIINRTTACPFCDRDNLIDILDEKSPFILLKNKFPTLPDTYQTVLIETDSCEEEFSSYNKEHLHNLIDFAFRNWLEMSKSQEYKSVLLFKNHGPLSGGSIHHAHMQIVGLKHVDYTKDITLEHFEGIRISETNSVQFTLSTKPKMGFYEFNVVLENLVDQNVLAEYTQMATHYILNHFPAKCGSYNLFFYQLDGKILVKVIPRFATSPLFVGYSIAQVAVNLEEIVERVKEIYCL
ncbi:DUF4931 domain-containing protein [Anaerobacillus alkaliphilus]|uniref:DUF4931 domain-containing protein n=1 Tax=Anaerobacillus alkaliphilus TaxID=1548597 RepID=A0A4Q0VX17_9BACI|nr:DUF4931 domain-containing protein [Anaerobacillus alkaliphilus]RXJ04287.1 DUF4931 domain-containing protein [Anaerobacillus alkaliphilus]